MQFNSAPGSVRIADFPGNGGMEDILPANELEGAERTQQRDPMEELHALNAVMAALAPIVDADAQLRVLQAAASFLRVNLHTSANQGTRLPQPAVSSGDSSFSEDRSISPKDFILQKQPKTDVERVTCLAFYLTNYRDTPHFKTIDISKLNIEAAQPKLSNTAVAMDNATRSHYLVPASKGNRQLSAAGEQFVQLLPDREAAKAAMDSNRPRRRRKSNQQGMTKDGKSGE